MTLVVASLTWLARTSADGRDCRDLGPVGSFPENSVARWSCIPAFVVHGVGRDFAVYVAIDPTGGGPLRWDRRRHVFVAPTSGLTFGIAGQALGRPGGPGLLRCPWRIAAGHLVVAAPSSDPIEVQRACGWRTVGA